MRPPKREGLSFLISINSHKKPGATLEGILRQELLISGSLADCDYYTPLRTEYKKKYKPLKLTPA